MFRNPAFIMAITSFLLVSCGNDDTIRDVSNRERDRELATAQALAQDNQKVLGNYVGSAHIQGVPSEILCRDDMNYDLELDLSTGFISKDGFLVPQPAIVGSLTKKNLTYRDSDGNPITIVSPFTTGVFTANSNPPLLSITLPGPDKQPAVLLNCTADSAAFVNRLSCDYRSMTGCLQFHFELKRKSGN